MKGGKAYRDAAALVDPGRLYTPAEAMDLARATAVTRFDGAVEVAVRLGVDPRKQDQMVRGSAVLPHGTGRAARVIVFAAGEQARAALAAGADHAGAGELIERVLGGWLGFDAVVATPGLMGAVGRLGRVLGPRGLMPSPKAGTVTADPAAAVAAIKGGRIALRADRHGSLGFAVGRASFSAAALLENYAAAMSEVARLRPAAARGRYLRKVTIATTMGPGIGVLEQA